MKKFLLSLMLMSTTVLTANAFGEITWGITGGINLTNTSLRNLAEVGTTGISAKNHSGWFVGPKVNVDLFGGLGVDAAVVYNHRKYEFANRSDNALSTERTSHSFLVPISLKYSFTIAGTGAYIGTGPELAFNMGQSQWNVSDVLQSSTTELSQNVSAVFNRKNMTARWQIYAGVRLMRRLELGLAYNIRLNQVGEAVIKKAGVDPKIFETSKDNSLRLQASIYF